MIKKDDKIADLINNYPFLKEKLIGRNRVFSNLNNPVVFNTVGRYARICDIAKVSGENLENLLSFLNMEINEEL